jgi:hypothetical protein
MQLRSFLRFAVFPLLLLAQVLSLHAQPLPFLSDDEIRMLANELSGDRAYEQIRVLSQWHRDSGMEGFFKAADYMMSAAREAGLEDVTFVKQPRDAANYTARSAELWMTEPVEVKLADIAETPVSLADGSHDADLSAELVWVADGSKDTLKHFDVEGKIVLTNAGPGAAMANAVYAKGAVGVVSFVTSESRSPFDVPDQIAWSRINQTPPAGKKGSFAFILSPRKGEMLKKVLETNGLQDIFATGKRTPGGRVVLKVKVDTEIGTAPGTTGFVEGWIRGSKIHDQQIIITAHLQEEKSSANDDGSGCANILEIARAYNALIKAGKMQRPLRDIRFWWTDEIYSEYRYFKDNPAEPKKFLANIHQDMVGANQAMGSRVQHIIFAPHSRTSYLDAVYGAVGTFLIETNNGYLAASRAGGYPRPYTRPLYSVRGTRDGYNARFVPYFNSSDHMCFVDGIIGVPAVATINWDDKFIHSSEDDLFQVDQTQLRRNQFLTAATAYVLARAEAPEVPLLAGETFGQGETRLANDLQAAFRRLREAETADHGWADASLLVEQGIQRELRAVRSSLVFAAGDEKAAQAVSALAARLTQKGTALASDIRAYYELLHGRPPVPAPPDSLERAALTKVPVNNGTIKEYFDSRDKIQASTKLHSLMRDEVFNFVDGNRSYVDIYKAVRAEQLAAGSWYYGTVTMGDVVTLLDAAVKSGTLRLR